MNPFLRVIQALNDRHVRYVIVGGFAGWMHGTRRITVDLDLIVDLDRHEARKAVEALLAAGFQSRVPVDPFLFADPAHRRSWIEEKGMRVFSLFHSDHPGFILDLFVQMPMEFAGLYARREELEIEGHRVPICSIDDLIELKLQASRPQDLLDIETLRAIKSAKRHSEDSAQ